MKAGGGPVEQAAPRARSRIAAIALGTALALALVLAAEGVCFGLTKFRAGQFTGDTPYLYAFSDALGYTAIPNADARAVKYFNGTLLYDVVYRTDEHGRRITPAPANPVDHFTIFFGCSFTFGEGVAGEETLPAQFAQGMPDSRVYNHGFSGWGPQQLLAKLETGELRGEIPEAAGTLVYVFISDHVRRSIGSMRVWTQWGRHFPYYDFAGGDHVVRKGTFLTGRPVRSRVYDIMKHDKVLPALGVDWPLRLTETDLTLTAEILAESRRLFGEQFPESRFAVLLYPEGPEAEFDPAIMGHMLRERGITVVDRSNLLDFADPGYRIPHDGHPAARAHQAVARSLLNESGPREPGGHE